MSPWMSSDTVPDPNRERCGNCGEPWEEHIWTCQGDGLHCDEPGCEARYCPNGLSFFRPESDEDRIADRAGARGMNL